ncbi:MULTISPECIES: FHA domain-containing protein [unclassified Leptolyngbya]|uniref:FHA domain-containing protein n=1 Tax=unclassified Leptolyngbya TaxID=2650499 RepID=UPI001683E224|nr:MULTISPECIES: FHA domain-containing protein [unclassified Leptolyngbya]MBD1910501.1 FHA domain-containing protein [Leptolyngbya sp. FACHB-8]MBD2153668.1 FHA domain-containing protein [Leptolyngbya sp. FACHB-16]
MNNDNLGHTLTHDFLEFSVDSSEMLNLDSNTSNDSMAPLVHWVCQAARRCQASQYFIQAVQAIQGVCLATNLSCLKQVEITTVSSGWAIGRSSTCAIRIPDTSISRCHAILNYHPENGFFITDLGSRNGTWVNTRRLDKMERQTLRDGDLLKIGKVSVEFFVTGCTEQKGISTLAYEETRS